MTLIYFAIAISILIFIHELGHFLFAKRAGILVSEFAIGFGPKLFGFKRGDTEYKISLLPFGGYVKMLGQDHDEEGADDPRAFCQKTLWQRFLVIIFGPLMNMLLCLAFMPLAFMIGREVPQFFEQTPIIEQVQADSIAANVDIRAGDQVTNVDGNNSKNWEDVLNGLNFATTNERFLITVKRNGNELVKEIILPQNIEQDVGVAIGFEPMLFLERSTSITAVQAGSPAQKAGLKANDKVISLNGVKIKNEVDLSNSINALGENTGEFLILRDDLEQRIIVRPEYDDSLARWMVGIQIAGHLNVPTVIKKYGFVDAFGHGMNEIAKLSTLLFDVLHRLFTFNLSYKAVGGPVMIAKAAASAASAGMSPFLYFLAFLSLQLCILNLLPFPVLDGGHLVLIGYEAIFRRPLHKRIRHALNVFGAIALISLMLGITTMDIYRNWSNITEWFSSFGQ